MRTIERLRGEWRELTDGEIQTVAVESSLVDAAAGADLIVFPSRAIGTLCEADALRPLRSSVLKSKELRFEDFLPLVRDQEIVYAQQPMALPIGCPTPLLLAPAGAPMKVARPDDDLQVALAYLAWAAPYAVHRSRVATLFDPDDFSPRLDRPPFVRALESFTEAIGPGPSRFVWPDRDSRLDAAAGLDPSAGLQPQSIPGAERAFDALADEWESMPEGDRHATLLASSGRLIGVTTASRNAATAFRYAAWLAGPENARQVSTASDHVAICRGSLAQAPDPWLSGDDTDVARGFAKAGAASMRRTRFLLAPRLPGAEEYLAVLANKVQDALDGEPAEEALAEAAAGWQAITASRGPQSQRRAYFRSINAERFPEPSR